MSFINCLRHVFVSFVLLSGFVDAKASHGRVPTHTVMVVLEAHPGKEADLEAALQAVVDPSRSERACVDYRLYKSIDNPAQFMLFENWISKEKHAEQFEKPYIKDIAVKLEHLLAKPYTIVMANEISD